MKHPICPGCEYVIDYDDDRIDYGGESWHGVCADEDKRINGSIDLECMRYDGLID